MAPSRVTATTAEITDLHTSIFGIGTVEAQRSYVTGPTTASRVKRVLVDVGDSVQAGQLIAEMDPVDLVERATAAQSALQRALQSMPLRRRYATPKHVTRLPPAMPNVM
ncbi:MAG: biotin/lipoyl-binding protein [Burkholderiaceae bacterium]